MAKAAEMGILDEMTSFFEERPVDEIMSAIAELPFERSVVRERFRSAFMKMIGNEDCIVTDVAVILFLKTGKTS